MQTAKDNEEVWTGSEVGGGVLFLYILSTQGPFLLNPPMQNKDYMTSTVRG